MTKRRWTIWLGPPLALLAIAAVLSQFQAGAEAGGRPTVAPPGACAAIPLERGLGGKPNREAGQGTWWTLSERLDGNGALAGRRLALGRGGATSLAVDLPFDTLASGPVAGVVVITTDDGRRSQVRIVSEARACSFLVRETTELARGAILDPNDGSVLVHLVDREARADLGTWRYAGDGTGEPELVAPPLEPDARRGPNWTTDLRLDAGGTLLAVQSCTDEGCLTRLFDLTGGSAPIARVDGMQGPLIGLADGRLITWALCFGFPCSVVSWDVATGARTTIVQQAESAALTADGRFVVAVGNSSRGSYIGVELATGRSAPLRGVNATERLAAGGVVGAAGLQVRPGEVPLVAPGAIPRPFSPAAEVVP